MGLGWLGKKFGPNVSIKISDDVKQFCKRDNVITQQLINDMNNRKYGFIEKGDNSMKEFKPVIYKGTNEQAAQMFFDYLKRNIGDVTHTPDEDYTLVEALLNKSTKCTYEVTACYHVAKKEETPEWVIANPGLFYKKGDTYCVANHDLLKYGNHRYRLVTQYFDSSIQFAYAIDELFCLIHEKGYFTKYDLYRAAGMRTIPSDREYIWRDFKYDTESNLDDKFRLVITTLPEHIGGR